MKDDPTKEEEVQLSKAWTLLWKSCIFYVFESRFAKLSRGVTWIKCCKENMLKKCKPTWMKNLAKKSQKSKTQNLSIDEFRDHGSFVDKGGWLWSEANFISQKFHPRRKFPECGVYQVRPKSHLTEVRTPTEVPSVWDKLWTEILNQSRKFRGLGSI